MLCQNELKLSKILMIDIIERNLPKSSKTNPKSKFNMKSIYNPNGINDEEKLKPFTSKIMQMKDFQEKLQAKEVWDMPSDLVMWWVNPTFVDEKEFQKQVLRRL